MKPPLVARAAVLAIGLWVLGGGGATAGAAALQETVSVTIEPSTSSAVLGQSLDLRITVLNNGAEATAALVVHIDITDPAHSGSVDPEDWTATLSKPIGPLQPGATATVDWSIQPISGGEFTLYAVAIAPDVETLAPSNVVHLSVADKRSLNPGGILPVAIGAPAIVAMLLAVQMRYARGRTAPEAPLGVA